ncbi:MAG: YihY/virulence factor BrkB family protein [Chlamydiales bacterium]
MDIWSIRTLTKKIWSTDLKSLSKIQAHWMRFVRILLLSIEGFTKKQIQQGASALTYYSCLGIVPIFAVLIEIARGLKFESAFKSWLFNRFIEQKIVIEKIFQFANTSLEKTHRGLITGIGILILLWTGFKIFLYLETSLNTIWEAKEKKLLIRRITDYFFMIFLCPITVLISSGITLHLSTAFEIFIQEHFFKNLTVYFLPFLNFTPFFLNSFIFTFIYIFIPNTRVALIPALIAGIIVSGIYQLIQWIYFHFQIGVTNYNAIYGTFAAFPLFLIWIHISWIIILLGAKLSFAIQHVNSSMFFIKESDLSYHFRMVLLIRITHLSVKFFLEKKSPIPITQITNKLTIPLSLTKSLLNQLIEAKILSKVIGNKYSTIGFQPADNIDKLTIKSVIDKVNARGEQMELTSSLEVNSILNSLKKFDRIMEESDANILLKKIN